MYGNFTVSRAATIGRVFEALGIDPPAPEKPMTPMKPMKRQADDLSSHWVVRSRSESEQRQRV